jgi:transposase
VAVRDTLGLIEARASSHGVTDCQPRHRAEEFLRFLRRIARAYAQRELHLVVDNSSTHTTPEVNSWLARHRRVHFHFTPTGAFWRNLVESWFSILTRRSVRRGSYHSVRDLIHAIDQFVATYNQHAQPFVWTKTASEVLAKANPITTSGAEH